VLAIASRGFRSFEINLVALASIMPLLSRDIAGLTGVPLGLVRLLAFDFFTFACAAG